MMSDDMRMEQSTLFDTICGSQALEYSTVFWISMTCAGDLSQINIAVEATQITIRIGTASKTQYVVLMDRHRDTRPKTRAEMQQMNDTYHDLRNVITSIMIYDRLLKRRGDTVRQRYVQVMNQQLRRLVALVQQALQFAC